MALAVPFMAVFMSSLVRARRPNAIKSQPYECGLETQGPTWVQFHIRYYLYALLFVIFDVEVVFLFPWAVAYDQLGLFALVEAFVFVALLSVGLVYAWRKGALEWR
ncbi:MAG: NADH-quinone oxidoreductase subunit A [Chloroflexi bacterium]|nr:NADH-quinone oxidoreductase subunit A [Chloroflexota bacterium]